MRAAFSTSPSRSMIRSEARPAAMERRFLPYVDWCT